MIQTTKLGKSIKILSKDKAFVRGFKRGIGIILLSWLLTYVGGCFAYPLVKVIVKAVR